MSKIILALDVDDIKLVEKIINELSDIINVFKVGLQLYTHYGNKIVEKIINKKLEVFLDLKLCDIPNTVEKAVKNITPLGISFFTVHTLGGREMLEKAKNTSYEIATTLGIKPPKVLGVTLLTSLDEKNLHNDFKIKIKSKELIWSLAHLARKCGLDGVIASPQEVKSIKKICGEEFLVITPGIRSGIPAHDQKRTNTAKYAIKCGADFIVVGRQIISSPTPRKEAEKIIREINFNFSPTLK